MQFLLCHVRMLTIGAWTCSILLLVYCRFLCTIDAASVHNQSSNVEVLKAIAGINFTVRMIVDTTIDLNSHLAHRPDLLDSSSPVTVYSAYQSLRVLSNFNHIITDAGAHFHDIYSSLHFFGKRWAVAGKSQIPCCRVEGGAVQLPFAC